MQGQKQIFTVVVILIVIGTFTLFRNAIKKDKQLKRVREDALRKKLESTLDNEQSSDREEEETIPSEKRDYFLYRFLEHKDICFDIHAIVFKPESNVIERTEKDLNAKLEDLRNHGKDESQSRNGGKQENPAGTLSDSKQKTSIIGPFVYFLVIVLVYWLIKAATDMSKHLKEKANSDDVGIRRCSLQEYAKQKHNRRPSKAFHCKRLSTPFTESPSTVRQHSLEERLERRISNAIPAFNGGAGLITEPGTPARITTGIAARPPPLLRRCSVPVFALQQQGHGSLIRRPSFDSFSEDDSSPDVKRRVRMIHRH